MYREEDGVPNCAMTHSLHDFIIVAVEADPSRHRAHSGLGVMVDVIATGLQGVLGRQPGLQDGVQGPGQSCPL